MAIIGVIIIVTVPLLTGADISWYSYEYHSQTFR